VKKRFGTTDDELAALLKTAADTIPVTAFQNDHGVLECICRYLKDQGLQIKTIAQKLNRSYSTITNTLIATKDKEFIAEPSGTVIPVNIFSDRKHAPLQALVAYLHDVKSLRFVDIAKLLRRDPRNIGAAYREARR